METLINLYSTSFIHIFNHLFNISIFKKKIRYPDIKFLISLNFALIKKKNKKTWNNAALFREGEGVEARGHLLCQVSHQKVKQATSRELGELKIATCQVKHRTTTTTRHVHVSKHGNWIRWNRVPPWWIRGVIREFVALGPCTMSMHVKRGVLFRDTNRRYPMLVRKVRKRC